MRRRVVGGFPVGAIADAVQEALTSAGLHRAIAFMPYPQTAQVVIRKNSPVDTEGEDTVTPPQGYYLAVKTFELTTDYDIVGNVKLEYPNGQTEFLLSQDQDQNTTQTYDAKDWGLDFWIVKSVTLYARAVSIPADDRVLTLNMKVGLVPTPEKIWGEG